MSKPHGILVRNYDRRAFLRQMGIMAAAVGSGATLLGACGNGSNGGNDPTTANGTAAPAIGGTINYHSWEGYDLLDATADWQQEHGIEIRSSYVGGHDDIHTRVLSPGGGDIDLITYYHGYADRYRELNVVSPIDPGEVPNLEHLMPVFRDGEWFRNDDGNYVGIPFTWGGICLNYRTDEVPQAPQRWTDLLEPEFEGRIAMVDDLNGNVVLAALILGYEPERMTTGQLQEVQDLLIQFKRQAVAISPSFGDMNNLLISGEAVAAFMGWSALNVWAAEQDVELECVIPEEGSLTFVDAYAIPPNAPNRENALAFINETLSLEVQVEQAEYLSAGVVREDAIDQLPDEVRGLYPYDDMDSFFEQAALYNVAPSESDEYVTYEDWTQMWQAVKAA